MAELLIALVVLLVLCAGIIQLGTLCLRHGAAMQESRRKAAVLALDTVSPYSAPHFMSDRQEGNDGVRHSKDDGFAYGDVNAFLSGLPVYADPNELEQFVPGNIVSDMAGSQFPHLLFGLVKGSEKEEVALWPVVRRLIYDADSVEVEGNTWLIWTKGVY